MEQFTITVFSENKTGLLSRVVSVFTRRHINIDSLAVSRSSIEGIHRFTIVVMVDEDMIKHLVAQLDKQVDVIKAFYYRNEEMVYQEIALYKIPADSLSSSGLTETVIRKFHARILEINAEFIVLEKTGHPDETEALRIQLEKTGIYEFSRSGRIAIARPMEKLNTYLKTFQEQVSTH
ncbi:MAG: acetolactate synthase small subunit [Saprospiraceae bacterium]|nr:acetolactate synthase small subunit [Saprospiraceae bacterium]